VVVGAVAAARRRGAIPVAAVVERAAIRADR
jgi:hypothetical protein